MLGFLFSIVAGIAMSVQGVFNTRLQEKAGLTLTNAIVQGSGFVLTLLLLLFSKHKNFKNLVKVNKLYFLGGIIGVIIIFTVIKSISSLGTTCATAVILVSQLTAAAIIDYFGLFNSPHVTFNTTKILGFLIIVAGIIVFKCK